MRMLGEGPQIKREQFAHKVFSFHSVQAPGWPTLGLHHPEVMVGNPD
jgi:hypothetical protein